MRHDLLRAKKTIHISLEKLTHAEFKMRLFKRALSMQEVIEAFAKLVATDHPRAVRILDDISQKKLLAEIEKTEDRNKNFDELDHESLYDLIKSSERKNEE